MKVAAEIAFDRPRLERLKAAYELHKGNPEGVFLFDGHPFVVGYAKYLIEYLETILK